MRKILLLGALSFLQYGCAMNEIATKNDVQEVQGKLQAHQVDLSEEVLSLKQKMNQFQSELEELKNDQNYFQKSTTSQTEALSSRLILLDKKISLLESKMIEIQLELSKVNSSVGETLKTQNKQMEEVRKADLSQTEEKLKVIFEEVSKENERLWREIHSLKASPSSHSQASNGFHVVQSGESLSKIASKYGISAQGLANANSITHFNSIRVGQKLKIPEK
ncbi:MAG: LysM peptidoglycan-binding domain-containing protein [Chlamydiae bacterium]|nr:LysM peptidoglycan-binding domain-containing protein [Chlamydiota bacterium]MBI3277941.1 LysM peptidoglycan-binding domain-containing protein [Chlamydiota bacterium]